MLYIQKKDNEVEVLTEVGTAAYRENLSVVLPSCDEDAVSNFTTLEAAKLCVLLSVLLPA